MKNIFEALKDPVKPHAEDFNGQFDTIVPFSIHQAPELPSALLPPVLADFVENIATVLSVPRAMPFMAALGMVSAAVSTKFIISPKPDWREPINIYTLVAMQPASNKSQTLKYLKSPIDDWEKNEAKRTKPERDKAHTDLKIVQTELAKHYATIKNRKSKAEEIEAAKKAIEETEEKFQEMKENLPVKPQIYTTDATPEAIADMVHQQKNRLAIISDEGGITEVLAGLYNSGNANIDIILKGIDGGAARIKRANKDYHLNPYLTVVLLIQPQVLANMADKRAFTGNGMLERYLYAIPSGNVGYRRFSTATLDRLTAENYHHLIYNLLSLERPEEPYILQLEDPAKVLFQNFRDKIERELRADGRLYICRGWGGKLAGYTLRIAGLMHVALNVGRQNFLIRHDTMQNAITTAELLMEHAVAAYGSMGADIEISDAKELLEWIRAQGATKLTKTDIVNAMRNRQMGKKERLAKALAVLVERNYLSSAHLDTSTKKPTEVYFVNPTLKK